MYYIKKYLRDVFISVILIISLTVTVFCTLNVTRYTNAINEADTEIKREYKYSKEYDLNQQSQVDENGVLIFGDTDANIKSADILSEVLKSDRCNISLIKNIELDMGIHSVEAEIILCQNENLPYKTKSGNIDFNSGELSVLIGKDLMEYTYCQNNSMYIDIGGHKFYVDGILDSTSYIGYNDKIILDYHNMIENLEMDIVNAFLWGFRSVCISSNISESELNNTYDLLKEKVGQYGYTLNVTQYDDSKYLDIAKLFGNKISLLTNALCILNVFIILNLWIKKKHNEFAIKKAFGASNIYILLGLLYQFFKCFLVSCILGIAAQFLYSILKDISFKMSDYFMGEGIKIFIIIFMILFMAVMMHIEYISKIETKNGLAEK